MKLPFLLASLLLISGAAIAKMPGGSRYVSMGSSYAAGPGVGVPDKTSGACERSMSNYARQVAARRRLFLVDVSCSGPTTDNILARGQHGFPPQIDAVTPDTKLVSILIGGNDVDYLGNLLGLSCRDIGGTDCHVTEAAAVDQRLAALPSRLDLLVAEIRRRAPGTRIALIGYLPAIPASGDHGCPALPLSPPDLQRMRGVAARLAQAIGGAAERNHIAIVRSSLIGTGHDACSTDPFVAGYHPPRNPAWLDRIPYHPDQAGMDRVASALDGAIGS